MSTLCYDFPLDNHFQCQLIQFIRTNNTSGLSVWMGNLMRASMPWKCLSTQIDVAFIWFIHTYTYIPHKRIKLKYSDWVQNNICIVYSTHHQLTKMLIILQYVAELTESCNLICVFKLGWNLIYTSINGMQFITSVN